MVDTSFSLYAELLSNIRQVSIVATLPTPSQDTTFASLAVIEHGTKSLKLTHDENVLSISLPGNVNEEFPLQHSQIGKTELSWRLPVIADEKENPLDIGYTTENWSAQNLEPNVALSCRKCREDIVAGHRIQKWKDLPSENWAEMMEFWHCHKPDDVPDGESSTPTEHVHKSHVHLENKNADRAYGANSRFSASSGVGFVDTLTFLIAEQDCDNIKVRITLLLALPIFNALQCVVFDICYVSSAFGGIKKASRPASAHSWFGHRYKYPISISEARLLCSI